MDTNTQSQGLFLQMFGSFSIYSRWFLYLVGLVPFEFFIAILNSMGTNHNSWDVDANLIYIFWIMMGFLPFILFEFFVIRARRKYGLGIFRSYLKSGWMPFDDFNENMVRLGTLSPLYEDWVKKNPNYGMSGSSQGVNANRNDLSYWFGLMQQGAISEEEYAMKNAELL